jgi:MerR family copper efflux transcriptional regulator
MNIGQMAKQTGLSSKTLRHYESLGLLGEIPRASNGYRQYGPAQLQSLLFISRARQLGFGLEDVAQLLTLWRDPNRQSAAVKALGERHIQALDQRIAALSTLRQQLAERLAHCQGNQQPECPLLAQLGDF